MASVLITGTSKGIGFETALGFGQAGHTLQARMRKRLRPPEQGFDVPTSRRLPKQHHVLRISSECSDVVVDPLERRHLVG
jgi:NAD(P)-dependent dehydrogenase (short-subunit alcohol dehydrogenase family)